MTHIYTPQDIEVLNKLSELSEKLDHAADEARKAEPHSRYAIAQFDILGDCAQELRIRVYDSASDFTEDIFDASLPMANVFENPQKAYNLFEDALDAITDRPKPKFFVNYYQRMADLYREEMNNE